MRTRRLLFWLFPQMVVLVLPMRAEIVHVYQQVVIGAETSQLADTALETGYAYTTQTAPAISGWIFTHWSISTSQAFTNRDRWGRSFDAVSYTLYEETTLTAHYLPASQDTDADGVADGYELYWYGNMFESALSDSDCDGFTFSEELAQKTNPLLADEFFSGGGPEWADASILLYNPNGIHPYILRSEPEGTLFLSTTNWVRPGTTVKTPTYGATSTGFAFWTLDGVQQRDRWGRALDSVSFIMPSNDVEVVAVTATDESDRKALYWYGCHAGSVPADSDGDGLTFAEELARGTNPLLFDEFATGGGPEWADASVLLYNPYSIHPYVLRSEPEGTLFLSTTNWVRPGTAVTTPTYGATSTGFAFWTLDGVQQRDRWGRALDSVSFIMPSNDVEVVAVTATDESDRKALYWYGCHADSVPTDSDGDGLAFAEELARGTNPLLPDEFLVGGGPEWADSGVLEANLQPYEQVQGAIVDDQFKHFFTSPIAGNESRSETFGEDLQPIVWDLNCDGLFDLVLVYKGGYKTFVNVGYHGNPEFEERKDLALDGVDLAMNDVSSLAGLVLDVPAPEDALSATTNGSALLVSDSAGRIWYYEGTGESSLGSLSSLSSLSFSLQHKVWGGSHAGFAEGLRLAAVDWDDDGDLDCLAGTADGKLMLLRDPKVGRPTNLKAFAGIDNILLTWDPNQQSRIRGYRVYRSLPEQAGESSAGTRIAQPPLPTYRDFPPTTDEYAYKVSSVSRFYTAGNSTPTESESPATEAVVAKTGGVKFFWNDAVAKVGEKVEVMLSIENSMNYNVAGKSQTVVYDPEYLTPVKVVKTGLTEGFDIVDSHPEQGGASPSGAWQIAITGAVGGGTPTLPAGGGKFLVLVFEAQKEGTTKVGGDAGATVSIAARSVIAPYQLGDVDGDGDVDEEDLRLLAKLKNGNGRKHTANQLKAGDFNGNGKLDNADYQELREKLKEKGAL